MANTEWTRRKAEQTAAREARAEARASRTDEEQLAHLDKLLGKGVGAKRERARLAKRIADKQAKKDK